MSVILDRHVALSNLLASQPNLMMALNTCLSLPGLQIIARFYTCGLMSFFYVYGRLRYLVLTYLDHLLDVLGQRLCRILVVNRLLMMTHLSEVVICRVVTFPYPLFNEWFFHSSFIVTVWFLLIASNLWLLSTHKRWIESWCLFVDFISKDCLLFGYRFLLCGQSGLLSVETATGCPTPMHFELHI